MEWDKYKGKVPCPHRPRSLESLEREIPAFLKDGNDAKVVRANLATQHANYELAQAAYDLEQVQLSALFETDALEELGLTGHPKAKKALAMAYEHGHHGGLSEMFCRLQEYAELLLED